MAINLITGGAGFIGSHLTDHLLALGERVIIIDNLSTGRFSNIEHLSGHPGLECIIDDVRNERLIDDLIRKSDRVYHLAASVGVRLVIERPTESLINNVLGTEVVLRSASRYRKPLLITSTSEVYGKSQNPVFSESDDCIMGATDKARWGYATSKALDEFLALAHYQETRLPVVLVRLFNTVGPRQTGRYGMVIPNFVSQALGGEPLTVFGDGTQRRCFAHVGDVVPALAQLMSSPTAFGRVFNIGSNEEVSIGALANRVLQMTGSKSPVSLVAYGQAYPPGFEDMERRVPDLRRIGEAIGYQTRKKLDDILRDVIADIASRKSDELKPA
jgi:UDP-glucose 4-epimerase